jgi:hypothetical protein
MGHKQKSAYANDLLSAKSLIAVSVQINHDKGSSDPALWLPPNQDFHCDYVKDWVEIKRRHHLQMDVAEIAAIEKALGADIEYAARLESGGWNETTQQFSSAVFRLGIRRADECAYTRQAGSTENIEVTVSVLPDVAHQNQDFSIFLVAELPDGLYSLNHLEQFFRSQGQSTRWRLSRTAFTCGSNGKFSTRSCSAEFRRLSINCKPPAVVVSAVGTVHTAHSHRIGGQPVSIDSNAATGADSISTIADARQGIGDLCQFTARICGQCMQNLIVFCFLSLLLRVLTAPAAQIGLNTLNAFVQFVMQ